MLTRNLLRFCSKSHPITLFHVDSVQLIGSSERAPSSGKGSGGSDASHIISPRVDALTLLRRHGALIDDDNNSAAATAGSVGGDSEPLLKVCLL